MKTPKTGSEAYPAVRARRHLMVVFSFIAVLVCYLDRVSIAVAIVPLRDEMGWSATRTGTILSAFFMGYLAFQIPAGWAARRFGPRLLIGCALVWWSLMTLLTPAAAQASFAALIAVRILMGIGEAGMFPGAYALLGAWVPTAERSRAIGLLFSAIPLGTLLALAGSGFLAQHWGWPWIFYGFGGLGMAFALVWLLTVTDRAAATELETEQSHGMTTNKMAGPVPWRIFLRSSAVWALVFNSFCTSWSIYVLLSWTPLYLRAVHGVSLATAGLMSAAPWITMFLMTNLAAWIADALIRREMSVTFVRKLMQSAGLAGSAAFLVAMPQAMSAETATMLLCGALGANALTMAGFAPNHLDLSPTHAPALISLTNSAGTLPGIIGVFVTGWIVDSTCSYDIAFYLAAAVSLCGAIIWMIFARGEPVDITHEA